MIMPTPFLAFGDADNNQAAAALLSVLLAFSVVWLVLGVVMIVGMWRVFSKAGQPGWAAIVPFYNTYVLITVAGKPGWWLAIMLVGAVLSLIPLVGLIFAIVNMVLWVLVCIGLAQKFGYGGGFAVGLIFLPFIFFLILGFGKAQYLGGTPPPVAA